MDDCISATKRGECPFKVLHSKEESDPAAELRTDKRCLGLAVPSSEQDPSLCTRRANNDPTFRATLGGLRRRIFDELKVEHAGVEIDCGVVVVNDEGNEGDVAHGATR